MDSVNKTEAAFLLYGAQSEGQASLPFHGSVFDHHTPAFSPSIYQLQRHQTAVRRSGKPKRDQLWKNIASFLLRDERTHHHPFTATVPKLNRLSPLCRTLYPALRCPRQCGEKPSALAL